jgi:hypothetical protein
MSDLLTCGTVPLHELVVSQIVEKFPAHLKPEVLYWVCIITPLVSVMSQMNQILAILSCFFSAYCNMVFLLVAVYSKLSPNIRFVLKSCMYLLSFHIHAVCPTRLAKCNNQSNIWLGIQIMKLLTMHCPPFSITFFLSGPDVFHNILFLNILSQCSFPIMINKCHTHGKQQENL